MLFIKHDKKTLPVEGLREEAMEMARILNFNQVDTLERTAKNRGFRSWDRLVANAIHNEKNGTVKCCICDRRIVKRKISSETRVGGQPSTFMGLETGWSCHECYGELGEDGLYPEER